MVKLFDTWLKSEFVVDEKPESVCLEVPGRRPAGVAASEESEGEETKNDLVTQLCDLLQEQERLEHMAEQLRSEQADSGSDTMRRFFRSGLAVLDGFDRIVQMADSLPPTEELQNWLKSVAALQSRMLKLFERFGLRAMDPVGKPVDLDRHEVIEVLRTGSIPDETVVEVRQKGYTFDGKILRDAQVVVATNEGS